MTKIAGSGSASGSISQRHGSADPDPDPECHGSATLIQRLAENLVPRSFFVLEIFSLSRCIHVRTKNVFFCSCRRIFVNLQTIPLMFSRAVFLCYHHPPQSVGWRFSSLLPVSVGAWALFNCR